MQKCTEFHFIIPLFYYFVNNYIKTKQNHIIDSFLRCDHINLALDMFLSRFKQIVRGLGAINIL